MRFALETDREFIDREGMPACNWPANIMLSSHPTLLRQTGDVPDWLERSFAACRQDGGMLGAFPPLVRSTVIALMCLSLAVALMGATPSSLGSSTVVIFPFHVAEGIDPHVGVVYGTELGSAITAVGGVNVVTGDPATAPADYLRTAKADGGDYYLIGFIAPPLNETFAVNEQLVSARSGIIVWSGNAYLGPNIDVHDQGSIIKNALLAYASRGYGLITSEVAPHDVTSSSSPKIGSVTRVADQPLPLPNEAYGLLPKPTATSKRYATAKLPSRFVVLEIVGSSVASSVRGYAVSSLTVALARHGQTVSEGNPTATVYPVVRAQFICAQTGGTYLVFGSLEAQVTPASSVNAFIGWADADLKVVAYDCQNQKFAQATRSFHGGGTLLTTAIDKAADAAVISLLKVFAIAKPS
jgi:hypothetical protein